MTRKEALKSIAVGTAAVSLPGFAQSQPNNKSMEKLKGNINHSACRWCYNDIPLEALSEFASDLGMKGIDLLKPEEWAVVQKHGLTCSMANPTNFSLTEGFNDPKNHASLQKTYSELIPKVEEAGLTNLICFSGNRNGISDKQGLELCAVGLEPLVKLAEKHQINLVMELLNSKVNHPDYQCDHTPWGVALCDKIGSDRFKLLYDIYHMQIMEGDVIATIQKYHTYIVHYHTGGVPGRNEIDESQELYYPAIMKAILETGYKGFVAQEFVPSRGDDMASLKQGVMICDV